VARKPKGPFDLSDEVLVMARELKEHQVAELGDGYSFIWPSILVLRHNNVGSICVRWPNSNYRYIAANRTVEEIAFLISPVVNAYKTGFTLYELEDGDKVSS
jgi:hypothetical protein